MNHRGYLPLALLGSSSQVLLSMPLNMVGRSFTVLRVADKLLIVPRLITHHRASKNAFITTAKAWTLPDSTSERGQLAVGELERGRAAKAEEERAARLQRMRTTQDERLAAKPRWRGERYHFAWEMGSRDWRGERCPVVDEEYPSMSDRNVTGSGTGNTKLSIHGHGYHLFTRACNIVTVNIFKCTTAFWGSRLGLFLLARQLGLAP